MRLTPDDWSALRDDRAHHLTVLDTSVVWESDGESHDALAFVFHVKHDELPEPFNLVLEARDRQVAALLAAQVDEVLATTDRGGIDGM